MPYLTFGVHLRERRIERGMSQAEVAERCPADASVTQARVSSWERGASVPSHYQARCLEEALGLTEEESVVARELLVAADHELRARHSDAA